MKEGIGFGGGCGIESAKKPFLSLLAGAVAEAIGSQFHRLVNSVIADVAGTGHSLNDFVFGHALSPIHFTNKVAGQCVGPYLVETRNSQAFRLTCTAHEPNRGREDLQQVLDVMAVLVRQGVHSRAHSG